jgi:hypothetical protein
MCKMLRSALSVAILCIATLGYAQDKNIPKEYYVASGIPDSLKTDANSVLRYAMEDMVISGPGRASIKRHAIVTVLNEKGNDEAEVVLNYNRKFNTVNSFEMRVYNSDGLLLKKYHKSDMYDRSAVDNETIVTDDRLLAIGHTIASYPTTIEIIVDEDLKSLIDLGAWAIQGTDQSIQNSTYHIAIKSDAGFRFLNRNTPVKPTKTVADGLDNYVWKVSNLKAIKPEEGSAPWTVLPKIYFAANSFEFYGIPGNISSWKTFGKWQQDLNADVATLSPQREAEIRKMTDTIKADKDKARFLYRYLQQNTRYVSVQLGIGGLKPVAPTFVDQKKYGDCKALSNYMRALLKAVNIPSYYAIINAGVNKEPANALFPYDLFNHVILCVPFKNDTTWLECTSNTQPFGKLGTFTENRKALIVTEDGGRLVSTPKSTLLDNQFSSIAHVILNPDGSAKAELHFLSTGEYRAMYVGLEAGKLDDQKEYLIRYLNMKQPSAFNFKAAADNNGTKEVNIDLEYDRFYDMAVGDKQFYHPTVFDLWRVTLPETEKRKADYYFEHPMGKSCITTLDLPAGFEMETLPANVKLKFTYGDFEASYLYNKDKNQVISTVKFNLNSQVIPAAKYAEMQQYMEDVAKAQNKKLVIKRKV